MFYDLLDLESMYPPELQHCQHISYWIQSLAENLPVVDNAMRVDPNGIIPLLPCILRSDRGGRVYDLVAFVYYALTGS